MAITYNPNTPTDDFQLEMARRLIGGGRAFFFEGFNTNVTTDWADIHPYGGDIQWPVAAAKVAISSSDVADNGTTPGTGVRSVEIHGLSATGADQDEIILTNGTAEVESTLDYYRVNKMHSEVVGTVGGSHKGDITCRVTSAGAKTGDILAKMTGFEGDVDVSVQYGTGEASNGYWTVPLGKVMYITRIEVTPNVGSNKTIDIMLYERENILDVTGDVAPRRLLWGETEVDFRVNKAHGSYIKIKGLTDLWFRAKAANDSKIAVWVDFYLVDADIKGA